MSFAEKLMELEIFMLSEISQLQKSEKSDVLPNLWKLGKKWDIGGTPDKGGKTLDE